MNHKAKTYFSWSSGKDAALAFYHLQKEDNYEIEKLITTVNQHFGRVSMHGLRTRLVELQAQAIGLPLSTIKLPEQPTMEVYNEIMEQELQKIMQEGFSCCGFGDIFLEDLKTYREEQLKPFGIKGIFPLWKKDTTDLLKEFIKLSFKAVVVCIKSELLDESFVGREIDESFLNDLPANVDPCGENGEFHTFCYDGPIFNYPIKFRKGDKVFRAYKSPKQDSDEPDSSMGFWFIDLIPAN